MAEREAQRRERFAAGDEVGEALQYSPRRCARRKYALVAPPSCMPRNEANCGAALSASLCVYQPS